MAMLMVVEVRKRAIQQEGYLQNQGTPAEGDYAMTTKSASTAELCAETLRTKPRWR